MTTSAKKKSDFPMLCNGSQYVIALVAGFALSGCVTWKSSIDDLRLEQIDRVIRIDDEEPNHWHISRSDGGPLVRILVSTAVDIAALSEERSLDGVASEIYFCDEGSSVRKIASDSGVYVGDADIYNLSIAIGQVKPKLEPNANGRYVYSVYLENPAPIILTDYSHGTQASVGVVNLENPTKPVCLRIFGGRAMISGRVIETNSIQLQAQH